ncbi:hypothetical protein MYAM1_001188 [Malassezia yamatoensis]|uniref:Uncharacterized protein n=1 Tax=Malassezia yamatoensis TaxID=253288 RepID=A0AAJ5YQW2_9BASI|nr:hypothetical protein MYAM1_001188 [Malassezia yamatoensis]
MPEPQWGSMYRYRREFFEYMHAHPTFASAAPASLISTLASFPFDSIKSRLQVKDYPSAWKCARAVVREEGVKGLFRGASIPLITITFVRTCSFSIYTGTKAWLSARFGPNAPDQLWRIGLYGAVGGMTSGTLISCGSAPFELVKVQRQLEYLIATQKQKAAGVQAITFKPQSGFRAALDIYRQHGGVRGFYLGFPLHLCRDTLGSALYFGLYDSLRSIGNRLEAQDHAMRLPSPVLSFMIGSSAGMLSWLLVYPVDLLKTQIQRDALAGAPRRDVSSVFTTIVTAKGASAPSRYSVAGIPVNYISRLYRGLGISALRSFISHGLNWMIIETILGHLRETQKKETNSAAILDYLDFQ